MPRMYMAIAQEDRHPIVEIMEQTPDIPDTCQWAIFLRNHDELTLEMVTSRERDYMYQSYAADPRARLNLGIRRRLAPLLDNDFERIRLMNSLLLSMPGSPIIYYGDEIGMGDNVFLGDRNGLRTPMQWSPDRNAGFSRADPQQLYLPPIMDPLYGYQAVNVEAQSRDRSSLLNWMKRLLQVRSGSQAFGRGTLRFIRPGNRHVLVYLRQYGVDTILCVANLSRSAQPVELDLAEHKGAVPIELLGRAASCRRWISIAGCSRSSRLPAARCRAGTSYRWRSPSRTAKRRASAGSSPPPWRACANRRRWACWRTPARTRTSAAASSRPSPPRTCGPPGRDRCAATPPARLPHCAVPRPQIPWSPRRAHRAAIPASGSGRGCS